MDNERLFPEYIFEASWEVCNKVGGIYTVLSTRAETLQSALPDHIIFIGPDCWQGHSCPYFTADEALFSDWRATLPSQDLHVKVGRWNVPGHPLAMLVDYSGYYTAKNELYAWLWENYRVDSLHAYGDYDESSMFALGAAKVVESFYHFYLEGSRRVIFHGNEWMTGAGLLYINKHLPAIATLFTTHATSIGRSIAGNNKPLYDQFFAYNGDQMAHELNMESKHSVEKQTARYVDCFTTVSDITAKECEQLLDKRPDVVLPNGFDDSFVPAGSDFPRKRKAARRLLLRMANALTGSSWGDDTLIVATSGRYEFRNKGIDVFIDAVKQLSLRPDLVQNVLALVEVPAWVDCPRADLQARMNSGEVCQTPLDKPYITHWLHNMNDDRILGTMAWHGLDNHDDGRVKIIFIPCYLTGSDGILNKSYYDLILGSDLCVYPSYYEPWGYTPLEAIAFKVPCITTDLAGFGQWAMKETKGTGDIKEGVKVVHRTDNNYADVVGEITDSVVEYARLSPEERLSARTKASALSKKALWREFIKYYYQAYDIALRKAQGRCP